VKESVAFCDAGQTQQDLFLESEATDQLRSYQSDNLSVFLTDIIQVQVLNYTPAYKNCPTQTLSAH